LRVDCRFGRLIILEFGLLLLKMRKTDHLMFGSTLDNKGKEIGGRSGADAGYCVGV
jgi:hypothetical protein